MAQPAARALMRMSSSFKKYLNYQPMKDTEPAKDAKKDVKKKSSSKRRPRKPTKREQSLELVCGVEDRDVPFCCVVADPTKPGGFRCKVLYDRQKELAKPIYELAVVVADPTVPGGFCAEFVNRDKPDFGKRLSQTRFSSQSPQATPTTSQPAQPSQSAQSAQPAHPSQSAQPAQPAQPAQLAQFVKLQSRAAMVFAKMKACIDDMAAAAGPLKLSDVLEVINKQLAAIKQACAQTYHQVATALGLCTSGHYEPVMPYDDLMEGQALLTGELLV
eukprot:jgi/Chrzof1/5721/Cz16g13020.t1